MYPRRIVCLTEETTETLYLLGEGDRVVGISGYTVRPPEARQKPKVSSFLHARYEKIEALEPDLILAFSDLQADITTDLVKRGYPVFTFNQRSVAEILQMIRVLAGIVGVAARGEALAAQLEQGLDDIRTRAAALPFRPKVFFEEWYDPLISGIRWTEELVRIAGGEPIFPFIPKDILTGQYRGKWENTPEGPAAWRRGVYVYRRRSLPYPMFDTFDHPDMNVVAGARNVSTVPTQALTLLNNPFVLSQADRLAARVSAEARSPESQADLAYRIALGRPPSRQELAIALDLIARQSLASFTHVLLNLDEFMYMR